MVCVSVLSVFVRMVVMVSYVTAVAATIIAA